MNELSDKGQVEPLNLNVVAARALELIDFALTEIKEYGWYQGGAYGPGKSVCFDQALHSAMLDSTNPEVDKAAYTLLRQVVLPALSFAKSFPQFNDKIAQTVKDIRYLGERMKEYIHHNCLGD